MEVVKKIWDFVMKLSVFFVAAGGIEFWICKIFGSENSGSYGVLGVIYAGYAICYFTKD